jgi:urease accessory protein
MTSLRTLGRTGAIAAVLVLTGGIAQAHTGLPGHTHGFADGVLHPLTGIDHMAAMVAVGLWATSLGGRARWAVPAAFVALLTVGAGLGLGALGLGGAAPSLVEAVIAASVVVLGLVVAADLRLPVLPAAALVGVFAVFHGIAHGAEMPDMASPLAYGAGFVLATASLHLTGIGLGTGLARVSGRVLTRAAGALTAAFGVALAIAG